MPLTPPPPQLQMREPLEYHLWTLLQPDILGGTRTIAATAPPGNKRIRAAFLRWFLLEAIPAAQVPITAVDLYDATITDTLDLDGCKVTVLLSFFNCDFEHTVNLNDANVIGLKFVACGLRRIRGDRLTAAGAVEIRAARTEDHVQGAMRFEHQLRLNGAKIRGNLTLRGCQFVIPTEHEPSIFADGLTVEGSVLLDGGFSAAGEVRLNGAEIGRNLDCNGASLQNLHGYSLSAAGAHIAGTVYLCETYTWSPATAVRRFTSAGAVRFDGARIDGHLDCTGGQFAAASTLIPGWRRDPRNESELYSLTAVGAHVAGDVFLSETQPQQDTTARTSFQSRGVMCCENAQIDGDFVCTGGQFTASAFLAIGWQPGTDTNEELEAIAANGINVAGNILFESDTDSPHEFRVRGCASLINAHVGRDFSCNYGNFDFPGEEPLCCDGITVDGTTFLDNARANGILRFVQANLKQGFYVQETIFDGSQGCRRWLSGANLALDELSDPACGIYAPLATVGATFYWEKIEFIEGANPLWLYLRGSKANAIEDDKESWDKLKHYFDVTGCQYVEIPTLTGDTGWRLRQLDQAYAPLNPNVFCAIWTNCRALLRAALRGTRYNDDRLRDATLRFKPQPYVQLADTYRRAGFEGAASTVLVRLERNRTRYSDLSIFRQLARWTLDIFLRYGHSPFRPLFYVLGVAVLSMAIFQKSFETCAFVYAKDMSPPAMCSPRPGAGAQVTQLPAFNPLMYAIDTLVPIVDFNQKKSWVLERTSAPPPQSTKGPTIEDAFWDAWHNQPKFFSVSTLIIFNTFFGWMMTTLFAAGVTGLTRTR
jgi:hypothetical protein